MRAPSGRAGATMTVIAGADPPVGVPWWVSGKEYLAAFGDPSDRSSDRTVRVFSPAEGEAPDYVDLPLRYVSIVLD